VSATPAASALRAAAAAVAFLTRIPIGRAVALDERDVGRGAALFPLVGAGVGALAGLAAEAAEPALPALAAGGIGVGVLLVVTGAFHLDALADTADALSASTRERALEIMRDPRIGTFGAAAIALAVLLEASALGALATRGWALEAMVVAGALSRGAALPAAWTLPYARAAGGPGSVLTGRVSALGTLTGLALASALAVWMLGWDGLIVAGAAGIVAVAGIVLCRFWLTGVTGDTLGATTEIAQVVTLLVAVALL
jgi:adenosylcobinamide-GDP ribazoletransferase